MDPAARPKTLEKRRLDDIRGLKPFLYFQPNWTLVALLVIAAAAVAAIAVWWARRPKPEAPPIPRRPVEDRPLSVRGQLDQLGRRQLIEKGRVRDFHAALSAIIRAWLGARYDLPGRRLTTTELLAALGPKGLERATYQLIEDFLIQCDLAKFAKAEASRADMEVRLQNAYRLVERLGDAPASDEDDEEAREGTIDVVG